MNNFEEHINNALAHLAAMISMPSFSKEEAGTANYIYNVLCQEQLTVFKYLNNVWALHQQYDASKPIVILNSHHDTVKPNTNYTLNPFEPIVQDGKLYGLGSNDAGASLVTLMETFISLKEVKLPFNLVFIASAEEEISGKHGIEALLDAEAFVTSLQGAAIIGGIVGEPTNMQMAVAERGLMVIDATVKGVAAHIANDNGENALYKAIKDIEWLRSFQFDKVSNLLGPVNISVASLHTPNTAHNVVPDMCSYIIDVRLNEHYTHQSVLNTLQQHCEATLVPRSMRLKSTMIPLNHPIVKAGKHIELNHYGSHTLSDKALMPFPTLKCGPGASVRSHTADEYVYIHELEQAIQVYTTLLKTIKL